MKSKSSQREYAWSYFQLHANQRMSTFNFYIVISALITTGLISSLTGDKESFLLSVILSISLVVVSFIFWKLDQRVSFLIKHAEETLIKIEKESENNSEDVYANLFSDEDEKTPSARCSWRIWKAHLTYSSCFSVLYLLFGLIGLLGIFLSFGMTWLNDSGFSLITINL